MSSCSSDPVNNSSEAITITDSLVIDEKYYRETLKTNDAIDTSAVSKMYLQSLLKELGAGFKYFILDTVILKNGANGIILAVDHTEESFAYFITYPSTFSPSYQRIYYDNSEGCYQTSSVIYGDGRIRTVNYDCGSDNKVLVPMDVQEYVIQPTGEVKLEDYTLMGEMGYDEGVIDIKTDTISTSIVELNTMIETLSSDPGTVIAENIGYTWGDCEGSYRKLWDKNGNTLYIFKHDCGDYGYGNDQFYLKNDSLKIARHYGRSLIWDDNEELESMLAEEVYKFSNGNIAVKKREKRGESWQLRTLENIAFRDSVMDYEDALFEEMNELEELLQLQELGEEEEGE